MFQNNFLPWSTQMWVNIPRIDSLRALPIVFCEAYRNDDNWARGGAWNWMALDQLEEKSPGLGKRKKTSCYKSPNWWIPLEFWGQNPQDVANIHFSYMGDLKMDPTHQTHQSDYNKHICCLEATSLIAVLQGHRQGQDARTIWFIGLFLSKTPNSDVCRLQLAAGNSASRIQSNSDIGRCWHFTLACKLQEKDDRVNSHIWQENLIKAWIVRWPIRLPKDSEVQHIQKTSIAIPFVV